MVSDYCRALHGRPELAEADPALRAEEYRFCSIRLARPLPAAI